MVSFVKFTRLRNWNQMMREAFKPRRNRLAEGSSADELRAIRASKGVGRPPHIGKARAEAVAAKRARQLELCHFLKLAPRRMGILLPPFSKHRAAHAVIGTSWLRKPNRRRGKA